MSTIDTWIESLRAENAVWLKALIDRVEKIKTGPIPSIEEIDAELGELEQPPAPKTRDYYTAIECAQLIFICCLTTMLGIAVLIYFTLPSIANL